jgi:hypothetical protein
MVVGMMGKREWFENGKQTKHARRGAATGETGRGEKSDAEDPVKPGTGGTGE